VPRDENLKKMFSKPLSEDFKKDVKSRIASLVKFAYDNSHETYKSKTKGVAFVRKVWNEDDFNPGKPNEETIINKIHYEVCDREILSCAKLYKVGLQANVGWGSRLPGKEIKDFALNVISHLCDDKGNSGHNDLVAFLYKEDFAKMEIRRKEAGELVWFFPKYDNTQKNK